MGSNRAMNLNGYWTDEKHVQFLNSMEASFVWAMFQSNSHPLPRLDRYLPDTSDSTLDLNTRTTRRIPTPGSSGRNDKKASRSLSSQPYNTSSEDQVVPQVESRGSDKAERDHSSVPVYSASSERFLEH